VKRIIAAAFCCSPWEFFIPGAYASLAHIRLMGVLNRIALAYFFTGLFFLLLQTAPLAAICAGLLIGTGH